MSFFHLSEHLNAVRTDEQNALGFLYPTVTRPLQLPPPGVTLVNAGKAFSSCLKNLKS